MSSTWLSGKRRHAGGWIARRYGERDCAVYLPRRRRTRRLPVVLALHGCRQDGAEFAESSRLTELAERHGLLLVAPEQGKRQHPMRCWRWYELVNQQREYGEPAELAEVIAGVLAEREHWRADPARVYAVGLSAGGAMALTLAATHPDVFAAVGVHSAPPYRSARGILNGTRAMAGTTQVPPPESTAGMAPAIVFQGTEDTIVRPRNAERVTQQWLDYWAAANNPGRPRHNEHRVAGRRPSTLHRWSTGGHVVLELWQVDGLGHAWSGGLPEHPYSDPDAPAAATEMWRFLSRHSLSAQRLADSA